jgi:hypothetical protein
MTDDGVQDEASRRRAGREARMSRRGTVTRAELAEVARVYREHIDASPTSAVRLVLGYGSERTAARRIKQDEEAGALAAPHDARTETEGVTYGNRHGSLAQGASGARRATLSSIVRP